MNPPPRSMIPFERISLINSRFFFGIPVGRSPLNIIQYESLNDVLEYPCQLVAVRRYRNILADASLQQLNYQSPGTPYRP